ncbi:hypothetical protein, partial [Chromobacterium piscinae]|uniref:hypothetical protein n=1 Tax=Chromobacterium piscinae TaxID=686831 RepID=UPI003261393A
MSCRSTTCCRLARKPFNETVQSLSAVEGQQVVQQIGVAFAAQQVVEQDAFLQRRQRVDVLDIGHAARH